MLNDNSRIVVDASSLNDASDDDARRGGGRARVRARHRADVATVLDAAVLDAVWDIRVVTH